MLDYRCSTLSHLLFSSVSRPWLRGLLLWRATKTTLLSLIKPQPQSASTFPPTTPPSPLSLSPSLFHEAFFLSVFQFLNASSTLIIHPKFSLSSSLFLSFSPPLLLISQHVSPIIPLPSSFPPSLFLYPWQLSKDIS